MRRTTVGARATDYQCWDYRAHVLISVSTSSNSRSSLASSSYVRASSDGGVAIVAAAAAEADRGHGFKGGCLTVPKKETSSGLNQDIAANQPGAKLRLAVVLLLSFDGVLRAWLPNLVATIPRLGTVLLARPAGRSHRCLGPGVNA